MQYDYDKHREAFKNAISLKSRSQRTIENYCGHLDRFFLRFKYQISKATSAQLTEYILNSGSASTMAQVHTTLNLFFKLIVKRDIVENYIPYPDRFILDYPSQEQMQDMISQCSNEKHKKVLNLLWQGKRIDFLTPRSIQYLVKSNGEKIGFKNLRPRDIIHGYRVKLASEVNAKEFKKITGIKTDSIVLSYY